MAKTVGDRERTEFGQRLRNSRKRAGLTQVAVVKQIGCSQGTLSELESTANGSALTASFAALYKVPAEWLAVGPGVDLPPPSQMPMGSSPPPLPPKRYEDRRLVTKDEWEILQAVLLLIPRPDLEELRRRGNEMRDLAMAAIGRGRS